MRNGGALYWLLGDHLGSTAYTVSGASEDENLRVATIAAAKVDDGKLLLAAYGVTSQNCM
jgi:hypothetical protein